MDSGPGVKKCVGFGGSCPELKIEGHSWQKARSSLLRPHSAISLSLGDSQTSCETALRLVVVAKPPIVFKVHL